MKRIGSSLLIALILLAGCTHRPPAPSQPTYRPASWRQLPAWRGNDLRPSLAALLQSCKALNTRPAWHAICAVAGKLDANDNARIRAFFERHFRPWQLRDRRGRQQGLITGYYEPILHGSRTPDARFRYPVYGVPDDLLRIELDDVYPQLKGLRLRGRLVGKRVVPYYTRKEIEAGKSPVGKALLWVDDPIELFFLHVQGSGRIRLQDGSLLRVGYADQNGHPYRSIGKRLVEQGELSYEQVSLQSIRAWARAHPERVPALLASNPSYVFFRILPDDLTAPLGALGVPLTGGYSLAVDRRVIPLGAPVYLDTQWPNARKPLRRLMMAQDTGGAIKGAIRADFFWGSGTKAGELAGRMKQAGRIWVLLPRGQTP
ncbi:MAG: transglycosylase [Zetaproteobacteria bacterium]|nr:MAG: transglycosylase [Zetaproteobacteria bacterium]